MPSFLSGFLSLGRDINKVDQEKLETTEGAVSNEIDILTLEKDDKELIELSKKWKEKWETSQVRVDIERKQKENEKYWLGNHYTLAQKQSGHKDLVDNLVFEALETYLPTALKKNPEPVVTSDNTPEGNELAKKVSSRIAEIADTIRLKLKLKKAVRHWALYYLGVIKIGWSLEKNEIVVQTRRPQQLIMDPDAVTDECEYEGEYIGDYRNDSAEDLIAKFQDKEEVIKKEVNNQLGTKVKYIEWWTPDYIFWTLKDNVLGKSKNPHWNYEPIETMPASVDELGQMIPAQTAILNHFSSKKIPYAMLSIFNLGKSPFDDTSQIEQVIPLQDTINKRQQQIDRNADRMNAGAVLSGDSFTKEQAKQAADAIMKGKSVWVPKGDVNRAYKRDVGESIPSFIYQSLVDYRNELRNVFGVSGLSSQGIKSEDTVRGKIMIRGTDTDRASPVVDHIEQFVDYIFNWMVQMMYVYYTEPHSISKTQGATTLVNSEMIKPLIVSVKEGSLIPKDRLTVANQSIDLAAAGNMALIDLYKNLEFPNPEETAANVWLEANAPHILFANDERVQAVFQQQQQVQMAAVAGGGQVPTGETGVEEPKVAGSLLSEVPV